MGEDLTTPGEDAASGARSLAGEGVEGRVLDTPPAKPKRRSRSGTSGAERARRRKDAGSAPDKAPRTRTIRRAPIEARMTGLYTTAGVGLSMAGTATDNAPLAAAGAAMVETAAACGKAWGDLAKDNPRVADALERMLTVSTAGALLAAHVPIALAAANAAGKLPAGFAPAPGA